MELTRAEWDEALVQRAVTRDLFESHRIVMTTQFLRPLSSELAAGESAEIDYARWLDPEAQAENNLAGWLEGHSAEHQLKAPRDLCHLWRAAAGKNNVDDRLAFGLNSPSRFLLDCDSLDWKDRWPRPFAWNGEWIGSQLLYTPSSRLKKPVIQLSSALPGSFIQWKGRHGIVHWFDRTNEIALFAGEVARVPLMQSRTEDVARAWAWALVAWLMRETQSEGAAAERIIGELMARVVHLASMARGDKSITWMPIASAAQAEALIVFIADMAGQKPKGMLEAYAAAERRLAFTPDAPIAGWNALESLFGREGRIGLKRALFLGPDTDIIETLSERYVYLETYDEYIDRERIVVGSGFRQSHEALQRRCSNQPYFSKTGKKLNPFTVMTNQPIRIDVEAAEMEPSLPPAVLYRWHNQRGLLSPDDDIANSELRVNTYPGLAITPAMTIDHSILDPVLERANKMLGLLTSDAPEHIDYIHKFLAHILQYPGDKAQVALFLIGGQGIGKSFFCQNYIKAVLGNLAGNANAGDLETKFIVTPYLGKLLVTCEEIRLNHDTLVELKKLIRHSTYTGPEKGVDSREHVVLARIIGTSNDRSIGLNAEDLDDRAFRIVVGATPESLDLSLAKFKDWAHELHSFYEEFATILEDYRVRAQLVRWYMDLRITRAELESSQHFLSRNKEVMEAAMTPAARIAAYILQDGRIHNNLDICAWFNMPVLLKRVEDTKKAIIGKTGPTPGDVLREWDRAKLIGREGAFYYFRYGYATLLEMYGKAIGVELAPFHPIDLASDIGETDIRSQEAKPPWRGNKKRSERYVDQDYAPDYLPPRRWDN